MIYITVGNHPNGFDNLLMTIDNIAINSKFNFYAQIGNSTYIPKNFQYDRFFDHQSHINNIIKSKAIITHAGYGSIKEAHLFKKFTIVFPRINNPHDQFYSSYFLKKFFHFEIAKTKESLFTFLSDLDYYINLNSKLIFSKKSPKKSNIMKIIKKLIL